MLRAAAFEEPSSVPLVFAGAVRGVGCRTSICLQDRTERHDLDGRELARMTPKNREVDRGDALAFHRDHIAVLVSVPSTKAICPARHRPASRAKPAVAILLPHRFERLPLRR